MNSNPYQNSIQSPKEHLSIVYALIKKRIKRLVEIEKTRVRGKISLPLTKEKFEDTSKLLDALRILIQQIDFTNEIGVQLADFYNDIGLNLSRGNIEEGAKALMYYDIAFAIVDSLSNEED